MRHQRWSTLGVPALAMVALTVAPAAGASKTAFGGNVCSLVTTPATRTARVTAPCVQQPQVLNQTWLATWGPSTGGHSLAVRIGPAASIIHPQAPKLEPNDPLPTPQPRNPLHWLGPVAVAPGINAYYIQSAYKGTPNGQGAMRFVENDHLCQVTLLDSSAAVLPGLTAVAKSIAVRL